MDSNVAMLGLVMLLLLPTASQAQTWSAEEQEILDHIALCWDAWVEATQNKDFDIWVTKCGPDENFSMWWTDAGAPTGIEGDRRAFSFFQELDEHWVDIRPVAIRLFDDVGLVQFYGYWQPVVDGKRVTTEYKRTEVFKKVDGRWRFLGGQGTPVSTADSDPYN